MCQDGLFPGEGPPPSQRGKGVGMVGEVMSVAGVYLGGEEGFDRDIK